MTEAAAPPPSDPHWPPGNAHSLPRDAADIFRAVLGRSSLPMAATEGALHLVRYANPSFCRLVGRDADAVVGHPLPGVLGETQMGDTIALLERAYGTGGAASVAIFRGGGAQGALHATYAAWGWPDERDQPAGLLVQVIDTTDQALTAQRAAQATDELSEVNRRLLQAGLDAELRAETHVALNAALQESEERLRLALEGQARLLLLEQTARGEAEAALRVRDEFLGFAAHELRSPLTTIKGSAQFVIRALDSGSPDEAQTRRFVGMIVASSERLEALLTDLLDVSRMRAEGLSARLEALDLAALAVAVARRYQDRAGGPSIVWDVSQQPSTVRGDAGRLEQVLDNLLSNAVKYSPGGGQVVLSVRPVIDGVLLTVRDHGIGLPAGEEERIFEPFRRARNAVALELPGIGLGLHISRQIAEAHGGTLRAETKGEGLGSTLSLWLPAPNA